MYEYIIIESTSFMQLLQLKKKTDENDYASYAKLRLQ